MGGYFFLLKEMIVNIITLKGGEAVYITLSDLTQIGIFLTAFTVMILSLIHI